MMRAIVTAGPTLEAIDPVRFLSNRSSGKQGYAIAAALRDEGFDVTLVSGPTALDDPAGMTTVRVESARDMLAAVEGALPADVLVAVAAVADWRPAQAHEQKIKLDKGAMTTLQLVENPDILKTIAGHQPPRRPRLVVGFAAETHDVVRHAREKRLRKGCDWMVANDVSGDAMGGEQNAVQVIRGGEDLVIDRAAKAEIGARLAAEIKAALLGWT